MGDTGRVLTAGSAGPEARRGAGPTGNERRWARRLDARRWSNLQRWIVTCVAGYVVLVLAGVTTSSLGAPSLRQDPSNPQGVGLGAPQLLRGDEYFTDTPLVLGQIAAGGSFETNPLTESPNFIEQLPSGVFSSVTFIDATLFRFTPVVPDSMLFAARWWLASLLLFVFAPLWFREITGRARFGALCAALVFFAPSTQWWSYRPVTILGFVFAGCYLAFPIARAVSRRRWPPAIGLALLAGICLARYPTNYQPFAIVLGLPVITVTTVVLVRRHSLDRFARGLTVALVAGAGTLLLVGVVAENWASIQATVNTVYPGERRSGGTAEPAWAFFSAPAYGTLRTADPIVGSNASEMSSGFTVMVVWAVILLIALPTLRRSIDRWAVGIAFIFCALWLSWISIDWGAFGTRIPVMNLVPPQRAMGMIGIVCSIAACLVLSWLRPTARLRIVAAAAALVCAVLTVWGGSSLRGAHYPTLRWRWIVLTALVVGLCVWAVTRFPNRTWPMILAGLALVLVTGRVNPVIAGLGDLRTSPTAKAMLIHGDQARAQGIVWASDTVGFDSLMMATAVPALSGRQQSGPDDGEWRRFDPSGSAEGVWNRAGTFIHFEWVESADVALRNDSPDSITVSGSPCELHRRAARPNPPGGAPTPPPPPSTTPV